MSRAGAPSAIDIFDAASRIPREARAEFLERSCAGDRDLQHEVESLLKSMESAGGFLDKSLFGRPIVEPKTPGGRTPDESSVSEMMSAMAGALPAGAVIGRYTVERVLGEGGMGVVYLAQQETPRRAVALKVIRPALATSTMLARFVREAELLGRLQHPGIAQIFEAGTARIGLGGVLQPYLAMELVRGETITDHARRRELNVRARLELVARLCEAVEHAHQRGLIHRDLKPANILVDEEGQPKILDFGVARAIDSPTPGATMATEVGTLLGTLAYMSPEQVGGDSGAVDTRSDIYGLGVILYELVCERRPYETGEMGLFEAARQVREQDPERPGSVRRELRGDIDTIILKAMAKDRERRYASAGALREDLRRHLAGAPILARQDSAIYVLRKTIRRHRGPVAAAVIAVAGLAGFGVYASVQSAREHDARLKAEIEKSRADRTSARLADELHVSNVTRARWLWDTGNFVAAEDTMWGEHLQRPDSALSLWGLRELYARHPSLLALPIQNKSGRALAVTRDGSIGAVGDTGATGGTVSLWRLTDGARLSTVEVSARAVWSVSFHPDGDLMATMGNDGLVRLWDVRDPSAPSLVRESRAYQRAGHSIAYSPDGSVIATTGPDRTVKLLDGRTLAHVRTLVPAAPEATHIVSASFDDTGRRLAFAGDGSGVYVKALDEEGDTVSPLSEIAGDVQGLAFTHDGLRLLVGTGGASPSLFVLNASTGAVIRRTPSANGTVRSIDISHDDRVALTSGYWRCELTDLVQGKPIVEGVTRPRGGFRARFLPGEDRVFVTGAFEARVWEVDPSPMVPVRAHTRYVGKVSPTADGSRLLTVSSDGSAAIWDTRTWRELVRIRRAGEFYPWVGAISPDGRLVAIISRNSEARLYNASNGELIHQLTGLGGTSADCVFTGDGQRVVGANAGGRIVVWRTADGVMERQVQNTEKEVFRLLRLAGNRIAVAQRTSTVPVWDVATGSLDLELSVEAGSSWCLAASPDASKLAIGFFHGEVNVWDVERRSLDYSIDAHSQIVRHLAFSSDGRVLATTAGDGPVKLWDVRTGLFLTRLGRLDETAPVAQPANLAFLPGNVLLVALDDGRLEAWDAEYFDRHIAGNLEYQLMRHAEELGPVNIAKLREWGAALRANSSSAR